MVSAWEKIHKKTQSAMKKTPPQTNKKSKSKNPQVIYLY